MLGKEPVEFVLDGTRAADGDIFDVGRQVVGPVVRAAVEAEIFAVFKLETG